jgi:transposase InsO family protein
MIPQKANESPRNFPGALTAALIPATIAATRLGLSAGNVRRRCRETWGPAGVAELREGQWFVSPAADPRLRDQVDLRRRDLQQETNLAAQGVDPRHLEIARNRREVLAGLEEFPCDAATRERQLAFYLASLGDAAPSRSQFYKWQSDYEADGLAGLVPARAFRRGTDSQSVLGSSALAHIEMIVNAGNRISVADAIRLAQVEAAKHCGTGFQPVDPDWRIGSYRTVLLALAKRPKILKLVAEKGPRAARAACIPKIPRDFESIAAGEEYVGDEKTLDVWCRVLTARGWRALRETKLTAWMDMRSRVIVGHVVAAHANRLTILGALKMALRDYGKPLRLRVDRGRDYRAAGRHGALEIGQDFVLSPILKELGIDYRPVEAYAPWTKPIESFYKTFKKLHDQLYAGFWGGCPSERHEDRAHYVRDNLEKLPALEDVAAGVAQAIDLYHHTPHGAPDLFGKTPLEAMAAFRAEAMRRETDAVLDHLFKAFVGPKLVRRDGVRHEGRWYGHGDARLVAMPPRTRVLLAIQPDDAGRAMVCDLSRRPLFEVQCLAISGLSAQELREMHRARRKLLRPYEAQQREARNWILAQDPQRLLAAQADAARALRPAPASTAPSLTVVRAGLEEAIEEAAGEVQSSALYARTGTDDEEVGIDELLEPSPFSSPQFSEEPIEEDEP